jgi:aminopeptidase N
MVYAKAALFFDALRRAVGDDVYYAILQAYVRQYRFRIAAPADFFQVAGEVSRRDLTPLIQQWVLTAEGAAP